MQYTLVPPNLRVTNELKIAIHHSGRLVGLSSTHSFRKLPKH